MANACLRPPTLTATCDSGTVRGASPDVMPSESPSGQRNAERYFEGTGAAHGPLFLERGVSLARVMGPPFCHEHGTGCFRLLAVVMVTDEMAAGQFGWSELTGFAGRGF